MTYFKLDIPKLNETLSKYKKEKKECIEDLDYVYKSFGYLDSAWNDSNSIIFKDKIKKDRSFFYDYFDYLEEIYNEINKFKLNIINICYENGYKSKSLVIKFDNSEISNCKKYLNNSIELLDNCLNKINLNEFDSNFEYKNLLYELRNEIKIIKLDINKLNENISNFVKLINKEINDSKINISRKVKFNFSLKLSSYNWKTTDINLIKPKLEGVKQYSNNNISTINFKAQDSSINYQSKFDGMNNNINLKENKKVTGLNNNTNDAIYDSANINLEDPKKINGINDNVIESTIRNNTIDLENSKKIDGLNDNIISNTNNQERIKFKVNIDNQINNQNEFSINDTKINFSVNSNIDLNDNIKEQSLNEASIGNDIIFDDINVSNGIDNSEVNNVNINIK